MGEETPRRITRAWPRPSRNSACLADWPFDGPVAIVETDTARGIEEAHVVDRWRHLGTARDEDEAFSLARTRRLNRLRSDIYKLLRKWFEEHPGRARPLPRPPDEFA